MIHFVNLLPEEIAAISGFLILKDEDNFKENDFLVLTAKEKTHRKAKVEGEEGKEITRLTRNQTFFTVTNVTTNAGIKQGYAMVKIKRIKNPLPKVEGEVAEETV